MNLGEECMVICFINYFNFSMDLKFKIEKNGVLVQKILAIKNLGVLILIMINGSELFLTIHMDYRKPENKDPNK